MTPVGRCRVAGGSAKCAQRPPLEHRNEIQNLAIALLFALNAPFVQAAETAPYVYRTVAQAPANVKDREIAGLFDRWNSALQTGNVQSVVDLYAPGAVLQPTVSNQVRTTPDQIKDYFDHFMALKPVGQSQLPRNPSTGQQMRRWTAASTPSP